jgi:hypothetical protein
MKTMLIGGCSFSQTQKSQNTGWIPWSDLVENEYGNEFKIINCAKSSFGQSKIVESVINELIANNFEIDYAIIQWSAIGRSYANNESNFISKLIQQNELLFSPYQHEYINRLSGEELPYYQNWGIPTITNTISSAMYKSSLTQIFLLKTLLNFKKIPYKMFWGWEQITSEIENENKKILDLIYDTNFWLYGQQGGMSEYIIDNIGFDIGIIPNDFHPSNKGHEFFYNEVIKNIIKTDFLN